MTNIKALLLDLDGTLINSERAFCESFIRVLDSYGIHITNADYKKYELEQNAMLLKTLTNNGLLKEDHNVVMSKIYADYEQSFGDVIKAEDVKENFTLLSELKDEGYILALISTSRRVFINKLIKEYKIDDLFSYIVAREDVANLKPAPDAYLKALEYLHLDPKECIAVEDAKRGIDAALKAGIPTYKVEEYTEVKFKFDEISEYTSVRDIFNDLLKEKDNQKVKTLNDSKRVK